MNINEILAQAKLTARTTVAQSGTFCPPTVNAEIGCTTWQFNLRNGNWRLASVSTYGNYSGLVHKAGHGCHHEDASGCVIKTPALVRKLNKIVGA